MNLGDGLLAPLLAKRVLWSLFPALMVVGVVAMTLFGEDGLLERHALKQRLLGMERLVDEVERENDRLRSQVYLLRHDPVTLEREAASRLLRAPVGSTIYRFEEDLR